MAIHRLKRCAEKLNRFHAGEDLLANVSSLIDLLSSSPIATAIFGAAEFDRFCSAVETSSQLESKHFELLSALCEHVRNVCPQSKWKEFVMYGCSDWEHVPRDLNTSGTELQVNVNLVVNTLMRVWSDDPVAFVASVLRETGQRHLHLAKTDSDSAYFDRMVEILNSGPQGSNLRVRAGSMALDHLLIEDKSDFMAKELMTSFFLPQLLICAVVSSAGITELATNVFCGALVSDVPLFM